MTLRAGDDPRALAEAAQLLARGGLVAFPTETVYGLGARADDDAAVAAIFAAKGRPADHPLIVHVAGLAQADYFCPEIPDDARRLAQAFWPGPVTVIVPRRPGRGSAAAGGQASIGLRCPAHGVAQALLQACVERGVPGLAAPSANRFGRISPTQAAHVADEFGPALWVLDGGACPVGIESTIVDCTRGHPVLLRPGVLTRDRLESALGQPLASRDAAAPRASGDLASHYAPAAPLRLWPAAQLQRALLAPDCPVQGLAVYSGLPPVRRAGLRWRVMPADPVAVAHELFAVLREFDSAGASQIWVEQPAELPEWEGVRDRLARAATQ